MDVDLVDIVKDVVTHPVTIYLVNYLAIAGIKVAVKKKVEQTYTERNYFKSKLAEPSTFICSAVSTSIGYGIYNLISNS